MSSAAECRHRRLLDALIAAAAWVSFLPVGLKYLGLLVGAAWAASALTRSRRWRGVSAEPGFAAAVALAALFAASTLWTAAPAADIGPPLGRCALLLMVPVVACACPPDAARRGLQHVAAAAAAFGALLLADAAWALPGVWLRQTTVDPEGNQRIANSVMLALGAALALFHVWQGITWRARTGWLAAAVLAVVGLALQDRRTGMVLLPLLLVLLVLALQRSWPRRALALCALALAGAALWSAGDGMRARFAEGLAELRAPLDPATVATSWGQRRAMLEITAGMVRERPWFGHGVGAWPTLWRQRTSPGSPLAGNTTPHNEYLLVATQTGLVGALLLGSLFAAPIAAGWHAGAAGVPLLLVWSAFAGAALINAAVRDAKLALPLLVAAALAAAARR